MYNEVTEVRDDKRINWHTATFMALFHIGAVAALFMFSWQASVAAVVLWWISASLGVGMGFHRLLTHRGYKTPKLVEYFITVCGLLALEGGAINWVVTHRIHHAHTDGPGDPHTPHDGGWWAHIGWMLKGTAQSHGRETMERYAPDMMKDRFHVLANNYYWVPIIFLGIGLLAIGGSAFLLWVVFLGIAFNFHSTSFVTSPTHVLGNCSFATLAES